MRSRTQQQLQYQTVQDAIKDLDDSMIRVRGQVGKRLDGQYQLNLFRTRALVRQQSQNLLTSPTFTVRRSVVNDKLLYESPNYSSLKHQHVTIPKSQIARDSGLLQKSKRDLELGYHQKVGQSHKVLPSILQAHDFSQLVPRDKVCFLKDQIKCFDQQDLERREKYFAMIRRELNQKQNKVLMRHKFDDQLPSDQFKIRIQARSLRKNIKDTITQNEPLL